MPVSPVSPVGAGSLPSPPAAAGCSPAPCLLFSPSRYAWTIESLNLFISSHFILSAAFVPAPASGFVAGPLRF